MPRVVTTFDVVDCNHALAEAGLPWRIHLHDACGAQTLSYERTDQGEGELASGAARRVSGREATGAMIEDGILRAWLRDFFSARGTALAFHDTEPLFWVAREG